MKKMMSIIVIMAAVLLVSGNAMAAAILGLEADTSTPGVVYVTATSAANLYGVAFTVTYVATEAEEPELVSNYFPTFAALKTIYAPITTAMGTATTVDGYVAPVAWALGGGGLHIAAAMPEPNASPALTPGGKVKLFTLTFSAVANFSGDTTITLIPTTITNASAGYTTATPISPVVGMDGVGGFEDVETVAELTATPIPSVTITLDTPAVPGDFDGDEIIEPLELLKVISHYKNGSGLTAEQLTPIDTNGNGSIDPLELLKIISTYKNQ